LVSLLIAKAGSCKNLGCHTVSSVVCLLLVSVGDQLGVWLAKRLDLKLVNRLTHALKTSLRSVGGAVCVDSCRCAAASINTGQGECGGDGNHHDQCGPPPRAQIDWRARNSIYHSWCYGKCHALACCRGVHFFAAARDFLVRSPPQFVFAARTAQLLLGVLEPHV
jgi:hypothetical protein